MLSEPMYCLRLYSACCAPPRAQPFAHSSSTSALTREPSRSGCGDPSDPSRSTTSLQRGSPRSWEKRRSDEGLPSESAGGLYTMLCLKHPHMHANVTKTLSYANRALQTLYEVPAAPPSPSRASHRAPPPLRRPCRPGPARHQRGRSPGRAQSPCAEERRGFDRNQSIWMVPYVNLTEIDQPSKLVMVSDS